MDLSMAVFKLAPSVVELREENESPMHPDGLTRGNSREIASKEPTWCNFLLEKHMLSW
jgi:hypothetical protein